MVAWLRSLLPQFLGGKDEPVKEFVPSLAKDDGFIPEYSKYISIPRATTVAPRRHNVITSRSCYSRADPPTDTRRVTGPPADTRRVTNPPNFISSRADPPTVTRRVTGPPAGTRRVTGPPTVTQRGRSRVMSDNSLLPPAYTPVSTQRTIHAVPGQTINIVTSSTTGLMINPYVHAN
ncbi:uncharacterized protein LACBIDRAFT_317283 [Laccaria bicolor S238N-H82]|uniref:Predicted protein n=1 Tax=Laccaria bicolor (strain S238N-H82 / ATCC MYA-4686) TaxID=486041 RepID=B0D4U4_LACBS|nr:uncharacterized protein LACBIDRAFT_317283 [Laccaria bicolor S238N-H82]EDR10403.1 predicted protein [Laccaria bicolor S238N-H82]|eukprot:XP_001878853.1 predicted protein [Laccaria bicolor S238N-H82]